MTTSASTGFEQQFNQSVRHRQQSEAVAKPKPTPADEWLEQCYQHEKQRAAEKAAEEARQIAAGRIRML
jgi:hypothetical protein